ncbi:MAG: hypothetical protein M1825_003468 [Sarcosagium campestre]|nr:MAG: hypothetical protein M1825_003468 [Sarcosagium campestre]
MEGARLVLVVIFLLFIYFSPETHAPTITRRPRGDDTVELERYALQRLRSSSYGDLLAGSGKWLELAGLRHHDNYTWSSLPGVIDKAQNDVLSLVGEKGRNIINGVGSSSENAETASEQNLGLADFDAVPVYRNLTGVIRGQWTRSPLSDKISAPVLNLTNLAPGHEYMTEEYNRNITGREGKIDLRLQQKRSKEYRQKDGYIREISGTLAIKDETSTGDGWEMRLHGVHYPDLGSVVLTTTSEKFAGIFALPHFTFSEHTFSLARSLLNQTLGSIIQERESAYSPSIANPWSSSLTAASDVMFPSPHCEFIVYLQAHPSVIEDEAFPVVSSVNLLARIEDELRFPDGAPVPAAPPITMTMTAFSPDCGFVLESKGPPRFAPQEGIHLQGPKLESYIAHARRFSLLFGAVCATQTLLLVRQMKEASTPSTVSRISFWTIAMMAFGDAFADAVVYFGFLSHGMFVDAAYLTSLTTGFIVFVSVNFLGMRLMMDIWTVQAPERHRPEPATTQTPPAGEQGAATEPDTLPAPATALPANNSGPTEVILPPDQDLDMDDDDLTAGNAGQTDANDTNTNNRRDLGAFYSRFYLLLFGLMFLSVYASSWPTPLRSAFVNILAFIYLSFWTPQIYRNVMRNCRQAFRWEFVVGQSILRLTPILYVYTVADNVLFVEPDRTAALVLVGWVWVQVCLLASGAVLGPRFFLPATSNWIPPAYDYHPVLRQDDLEAGVNVPLGLSSPDAAVSVSTSGSLDPSSIGADGAGTGVELVDKRSKDTALRDWEFDCAICMQNIDVPIVPADGTGGESSAGLGAALLARRSYMVTPCRHIFHS